MRDFQTGGFGEADDATPEDAQPGGAGVEFLAALEQCLVTDADAQKGFARLDETACRFEQFLFAQGMDAVVKRTDAGQHQTGGIADFFGPLYQPHFGPHLEQ